MANKIFVVDDDPDNAKALQYRLESNGFEIETCSNGAVAYDKILESDFDLILMDYFMPGLKGDDVCRDLRENARFKTLPILIMTGFTNYPESYFLHPFYTIINFNKRKLSNHK